VYRSRSSFVRYCILSLLLSGCVSGSYVEYAHESMLRDGSPWRNNRPEGQTDIMYTGYRYRDPRGYYLDAALGVQLPGSDLEGRDPVARFKVGWEKY